MSASRHKNRVLPICYAVWITRMRSIVFIAAVAASTLTPASAQEALQPTFYSRLPAATSLATHDPLLFLLDTTVKTRTNPAVVPAVLGSLVGLVAGGFGLAVVGARADCRRYSGDDCGLAGAFYGFAIGSLVGSTLGATVATR